MVVAPFYFVGGAINKKIDYINSKLNPHHSESEEHQEMLLPGYIFTPESGLHIPLSSEGGLPVAGHQQTYVIIKEHVPLPHQHIVIESPELPIAEHIDIVSGDHHIDDIKITSNHHDKIDVEPSVEKTVLSGAEEAVENSGNYRSA
jgi:hypothetical protein